jgi:hypothetical protein
MAELSPEQWQTMALRMAGCLRQNAVFEVAFAISTAGGQFFAAFNGEQTAALPYNVSAPAFAAALQFLPSIGVDGAKVNGIPKGPYFVEMTGALSGQIVPDIVLDGSQLDPPHSPVATIKQQGQPDDYSNDAVTLWEDEYIATAPTDSIRMLNVAVRLVMLRMAKLSTIVDTDTGQVDRTMIKGSQLMLQAERQKQAIEDELSKQVRSVNVGDISRTQFGVMTAGTTNGLPLYQMGFNPFSGRFG